MVSHLVLSHSGTMDGQQPQIRQQHRTPAHLTPRLSQIHILQEPPTPELRWGYTDNLLLENKKEVFYAVHCYSSISTNSTISPPACNKDFSRTSYSSRKSRPSDLTAAPWKTCHAAHHSLPPPI